MNKKINIADFQFDPQEMARQFYIVISRGDSASEEILEHTRQIFMAVMSRADKPEVLQPFVKLLTAFKDGIDVNVGKMTQIHADNGKGIPAFDAMVTRGKAPEEILPRGSVKYLRRLEKLGLLDKDFQLIKEPDENPTTRSEAMYITLRICKALGKDKTQWKPFQEFWGIDNLAQEKWKWENRGSMSPRKKLIDKAFEDC